MVELKQKGRISTRQWLYDSAFVAMRPGKRISRNGNIYYESRRNRADINPLKRL
jgi:hypothetical protein